MSGATRLGLATLTLAVLAVAAECRAQTADLDHSIWHLKTTLWDDDDVPDLVMIKKRPSGTGSTEVHIYSGASRYKTALVEVGTALPYTDEKWEFAMADWDLDGLPDLWAINRDGSRRHKVEVHILSGALFFQQYLLHSDTPFDAVGPEAEFLAVPPLRCAPGRPNLMMILRERTGTRTTEVHIVDGASNFKRSVLDAATALPETGTGPGWQFQAGDFDGDRVLDLLAMTSQGGGAVYVVDGKSNLKSFSLRGQVVNAAVVARLTEAAPLFAELEAAAVAKMEAVAADPLVPAGVGPRTTLMNGTYAASAVAELSFGLSVSQAVREFRRAAAAGGEAPRDDLRKSPISTRLEILPLRQGTKGEADRGSESAVHDATGSSRASGDAGTTDRGNREGAPGYEYRVVAADEGDAAQLEAKLKRYDREGWEVVGTIGGRSMILKRVRKD